MTESVRSDDDYITFDPFFGGESELTCRSVKIRKARTNHECYGSIIGVHDKGHFIGAGEKYRYEKALVDGSFWGQYKICLKCMDRFISEMDGDEEDDD